jgi:hypothetical protein
MPRPNPPDQVAVDQACWSILAMPQCSTAPALK